MKNTNARINPGYYLPNNSLTQSYCSYSGSNCLSCYGSYNNPICTQCNSGYYLSNNKCIKKCNLGYYHDYCKTCDEKISQNCGSFHDGYYLAIHYKRYCSYCGSYRIKKYHQESNYSIIIDECYSDYLLLRNSCVEKCDISNYWSRCLVCNEEPDKLDQCKRCKEGYYLPTNSDMKIFVIIALINAELVKVHLVIQNVLNVMKDINWVEGNV